MKPKIHPQAVAFINSLQRYREDHGALAKLRGAISEARRPGAWPLLGKSAIGERRFEIVAALWAIAPELNCSAGNLGDTLAILAKEHKSFDGRFQRLLTCDYSEIVERIAPVVRAAQAKGGRVNYTQLLSDLLWWGDKVQVAWAKSFWGATEPDDGVAANLMDSEEATPATEAQS